MNKLNYGVNMNLTSKRKYFEKVYTPFGYVLAKANIPPNFITFISIVLGMISSYAYFKGKVITGATFLFWSGIFDLCDGFVARKNNKCTKFGAVVDWLADKWVDAWILGAIAFTYTNPYIAIWAISASMLHTFIKPVAYAEIGYEKRNKGKIIDPLENTGFFGRPETLMSVLLFSILERIIPGSIKLGIYFIAIATTLSLGHRIYYLYKNYASYEE